MGLESLSLFSLLGAPELSWWVIILMAIGALIAAAVIIIIIYGCMLSGADMTWADVRSGWIAWYKEDPKSRVSFCSREFLRQSGQCGVIRGVQNKEQEEWEGLWGGGSRGQGMWASRWKGQERGYSEGKSWRRRWEV